MAVILYEKFLSLPEAEIQGMQPALATALKTLEGKTGAGNDFLGWIDLPSRITEAELADISSSAERIRKQSDAVVFVGIGGSYLGTRAVIEAVQGALSGETARPRIYYAGHNISSDYMTDLLKTLEGKEVSIIVISKSGTTTEPAVAFRVLKRMMEKKYGAAASGRIFAITDAKKGALRKLTSEKKYASWVIPDDVGGRFSVLTPVGLLSLAVAGVDIRKLVAGAKACQTESKGSDSLSLPLNRYAAIRNILYRKGKKIEILANFEPALHYLTEWWKQLYGESEGKDGKGIFPAGVDLTTDLHSMGQWIQQAERTIFETFLLADKSRSDLRVEAEADDSDGLNYLAGETLHAVNGKAWEGTALAHSSGGVPSLTLRIPSLTEEHIGYLVYFFEKACGLSGYMLGVNPFDQPGVEEYKKNMFRLLKKPGY
jgi:glucose-6-phosphate isomerase